MRSVQKTLSKIVRALIEHSALKSVTDRQSRQLSLKPAERKQSGLSHLEASKWNTSPNGQRIIDSLERDVTHMRAIAAALKESLINRLDELRDILCQQRLAA